MGKSIEELAAEIEQLLPVDVHEKHINLPNGAVLQVVRLKRPSQ